MATATRAPGTTPAEDSLPARYESVRARIAEAAIRSGRRPEDVLLVAVTKYASIEDIRQLVGLGHVDLGESRVQVLVQHAALIEESLERHRALPSAARSGLPDQVRWHMIGHLQRNKVRKVLGLARLIHSVDSLRLAEELQQVAAHRSPDDPQEILLQVNVAGERQKFGIAPAAVQHLIDQIDTMFSLRVRGMMCMAPIGEDPEAARPVFTRAKELFDEIQRQGVAERFDILSMGMTSDFEVAVECGANMVRVGSAIFGAPSEGDSPDEPGE